MDPGSSVRFFDAQFQRQVREADLGLNPFERIALPWLAGKVLDYGCGLGNLAIAAAQRGCPVLALDASPTAIAHLRRAASEQALPIEAAEADLRSHELTGEFDAVVSIGLLMFFDCATAMRQLQQLQAHTRAGGVAVVNVLVEGTTYLDMFDPQAYCLFARDGLPARFAGWDILELQEQDFPAPNGQVKSFVTLVARKPLPALP
jgi:tellurite methyltransferase